MKDIEKISTGSVYLTDNLKWFSVILIDKGSIPMKDQYHTSKIFKFKIGLTDFLYLLHDKLFFNNIIFYDKICSNARFFVSL